MPRPSPFVESDLRERETFGFGPVNDRPARKKLARNYNEELGSLGLGKGLRVRCEEELDCIFRLHGLEERVGQQETPGRRARAFRRELQWRKQRERGRKRTQRLPPALEQEMWREVLKGLPSDRAEVLLTDKDVPHRIGRALAELSREPSNPGRIKSYALMRAVRGLQELASRYRKEWAWATGETPPRQLVDFIRNTLGLWEITCPDEHNQDRLIALMVSPQQRFESPGGAPP